MNRYDFGASGMRELRRRANEFGLDFVEDAERAARWHGIAAAREAHERDVHEPPRAPAWPGLVLLGLAIVIAAGSAFVLVCSLDGVL